MTAVFSACALLGGTLLVCQTLLSLIGLGGDHAFGDDIGGHDVGGHDFGGHETAGSGGPTTAGNDVEHHGSTAFFGIITFRTVVAAMTFFGLTGLAAESSQFSTAASLAMAVGAGIAAMYSVHWMMSQLARLRADGSVRIDHAVGKIGTVYLKIPGHLGGAGKINVNLQNRTVELSAWTENMELPTGASVVVTRIVGPDSVEVLASSIPAEELATSS
jgi:hypothetical protein